MIDRFNHAIIVGWQPHELEWLEACATLNRPERWEAYDCIASMTGRKPSAIKAKVESIIAHNRNEARSFLALHLRKDWQSLQDGSRRAFVQSPTLAWQKHNMPPSAIRAVSEAAKMSGMAKSIRPRAVVAGE